MSVFRLAIYVRVYIHVKFRGGSVFSATRKLMVSEPEICLSPHAWQIRHGRAHSLHTISYY